MKRRRLVYVELKSGQNDRGPAWIGYAEGSKTGRTVYFNDRAFRAMEGWYHGGNHRDVETGEGYWISGVKREGGDRHWAGGGLILVEREALEDYLELRGRKALDPQRYGVFSQVRGNVRERVLALENAAAESVQVSVFSVQGGD